MEPALVLSFGEETVSFDDDEFVALSELHFLCASEGATVGRMVVSQTTLSPREVESLGVLLSDVEDVIYARGRSVTAKDPAANPETLRAVSALRSAVEKPARAVKGASAGAPLSSAPRETYEYF